MSRAQKRMLFSLVFAAIVFSISGYGAFADDQTMTSVYDIIVNAQDFDAADYGQDDLFTISILWYTALYKEHNSDDYTEWLERLKTISVKNASDKDSAAYYIELAQKRIDETRDRKNYRNAHNMAKQHLEYARKALQKGDEKQAKEEALLAIYVLNIPDNEVKPSDEVRELVEKPLDEIERSDFKTQPQMPKYYIVRSWEKYGDCLRNIAQWFYGDEMQWKKIHKENPYIQDPDLIYINTRIFLPSLHGEKREGIWDTSRTSPSLFDRGMINE
jgi:hypothetical protein